MTCREFARLWDAGLWTRPSTDTWPAAARDHLRECASCAAWVRSDRATDRFLHRLREHPGVPDVNMVWSALRRALEGRPDLAAGLRVEGVGSPRTILAVDDERHVVRLVEMNLTRAGYQVVTASDGREALRKVEVECPDLVVLDLMMPHMDGFEVLRRLKADPATATLPVIMLTARAPSADVFHGWHSGVDGYLAKPFNPLELLAFVRRIFDGEMGPGSAHLGS